MAIARTRDYKALVLLIIALACLLGALFTAWLGAYANVDGKNALGAKCGPAAGVWILGENASASCRASAAERRDLMIAVIGFLTGVAIGTGIWGRIRLARHEASRAAARSRSRH